MSLEQEDRWHYLTDKQETDLCLVAWLLDLGKTEDALIKLERMFPRQLKDLRGAIKKHGVK